MRSAATFADPQELVKGVVDEILALRIDYFTRNVSGRSLLHFAPLFFWVSVVQYEDVLRLFDLNHAFSILFFICHQVPTYADWIVEPLGRKVVVSEPSPLAPPSQVSQWLLAPEVSTGARRAHRFRRGSRKLPPSRVPVRGRVDAGVFGQFSAALVQCRADGFAVSAVFAAHGVSLEPAGWCRAKAGGTCCGYCQRWHPMRDGLSSSRRGPPSRPSLWKNACEC